MMKKMLRYILLPIMVFVTMSGQAAQLRTVVNDSLKVKGFHIDLRIQVMKMPELKRLVKNLAGKGINTILMEWEGTYPFTEEPLISNRYAYSRAQIIDFIAYCHSLGLDVIPLQQSFGHVEYILKHYRYANLREDPVDFSQVCPSELEADRQLFTRLYKDLIETHNSPYIHVGGDETHLLGHCDRCKKKAAEFGISRVYFDYIKMLCQTVVSLGKRPMVWADMALKYPEYINELPKQTIFVDWNYGWEKDRFGEHDKLLNSGYEIWGALALRSDPDNYFLTTWQHHFDNIKNFIPECRQMGYKGIVMTSWSTSGEYFPVFEADNDLVDLFPVRHVYPISGFDLLIDAYSESLKDSKPLNTNAFIDHYCLLNYGFSAAQAKHFRTALFMAPYKVVQGVVESPHPITINQLIDSARSAAAILHALKPGKGFNEFQHYILMADIRVFYLQVIEIEKEINQEAFNNKERYSYIARLKQLLNISKQLNERFNNLNERVLYNAALTEENSLRNHKLLSLYHQLVSIK